jgi:carbon storage regulator
MLVLSRKEGERLMIGDRIVVTVVDIGGGRVKLGVTAPRNIGIRRDELHVHVEQEHADMSRTQRQDESPLFAEC